MSEEKEGSEYKVPLTTIKEIKEHDNATSLEIAVVYGFEIIVGKGQYEAGDPVVFIPPDSIIPQDIENILFSPDSKIKLNKHRIRQIKIRGKYSQGMLLDPLDVIEKIMDADQEDDLSEILGITKYEPPQAKYQAERLVRKRDKARENPFFHKYGGIDNFKWYPDLFTPGEMVSITEKIHGSNIRFGYVPYVANNLFRKILKFLGLAPKWEWVYGSNNVQYQQKLNKQTGFYGTDVYGAVLQKYGAKEKVEFGEIWYGELYGDGIQGNYHYGCSPGEHKLIVFDLKYQNGVDANKFADAQIFAEIAKERGFEVAPELYRGPFDMELAKSLTTGDSVLVPSQKVREGAVIKPLLETESTIGRKMLKLISEKYLEKDQTEFH